jgi:hypothetical protein
MPFVSLQPHKDIAPMQPFEIMRDDGEQAPCNSIRRPWSAAAESEPIEAAHIGELVIPVLLRCTSSILRVRCGKPPREESEASR